MPRYSPFSHSHRVSDVVGEVGVSRSKKPPAGAKKRLQLPPLTAEQVRCFAPLLVHYLLLQKQCSWCAGVLYVQGTVLHVQDQGLTRPVTHIAACTCSRNTVFYMKQQVIYVLVHGACSPYSVLISVLQHASKQHKVLRCVLRGVCCFAGG